MLPAAFAFAVLVADLEVKARDECAVCYESADTIVVNSTILNRARRVFVAVPASHARTSRSYPVVIVLDGEANFTPAVTIAATLARLGHFPEAIVVGIPNFNADPRDRVHDMTPPGLSVNGSSLNEGGDLFLEFIEKELLPLVRARYRGGAPNMIVGHSSGGVIATYAAATRPKVFPVIVSIDAPIRIAENWLVRRLVESARAPLPLRYVSLDARFPWSDSLWNALSTAAPATWRLKRETLEGESHESMGFLAMYQGLKFAFADYSIVGAPLVPRATATAAFAHYRNIESQLAATLPPPASVLRQMITDLLIEGQIDPARRALSWLIDGYGPQSDSAQLRGEIDAAAALPPFSETVASLKATPRPTPAEIAPYVGTWRGEQWMNPESKHPIALRIRVDGGRVIAEKLYVRGGVEEAEEVEYLKVVDGGLHFGNMNGMRPMAMVVSEGTRTGNVLEGALWFRGVRLPPRMPNGEISFRLVKQ